MRCRDYVIPEDVVEMAMDVLSHRIIISSSARTKGIKAREIIKDAVDRAMKNTSKVL